MNYKSEAGDLSGHVVKELDRIVIGAGGARHVGANPQLDTWSGKVGNVRTPAADGELQILDHPYWNEATQVCDLSSPPTVDVGGELGYAIGWVNTGLADQIMWVLMTIKDPTGAVKKTCESPHAVESPGFGYWHTCHAACDVPGDWTIECILYGET